MGKVGKLEKILSLFDQFHDAIARIDDPIALRLVHGWKETREQYPMLAGVPRGTLVAGAEGSLRDMPGILESMRPEAREQASKALAAAIKEHYPEFLIKDAERLDKIKVRGCIRGKSEFYLVRHHVDLLEGEPGREVELGVLHGLIDQFEARGV